MVTSTNGLPMSKSAEAIKLEGVRKEFDGTVAVDDLDLRIRKGEIYGFLGPNGAGKTTTIKMIAGLMSPTAGRITVWGTDVATNPLTVRRKCAYVPDQPYVYDKLTGREFLNFVGRLYDVPEAEIEAKIDQYADLFEMHEYLDDLGETYSHGMKQRVVLSATFLHEPRVILVDEPLVGLDPESSHLVRRMFRNQVEQGNTIFMSTHVLSIAEDVADRIGMIKNARLIEEGTLSELRRRSGRKEAGLEEVFLNLTGGADSDTRSVQIQ